MYLKAVSTASVTMTTSGPSRSASRCAPTTLAPVEMPPKIPSSRARRSIISSASSSAIASTWSTLAGSHWGTTNPAQPCMAKAPPGPPLSAAEPAGSRPLDGDASRLRGVGHSHQGASGADAVGVCGHATPALLPDLLAEEVATAGDDALTRTRLLGL